MRLSQSSTTLGGPRFGGGDPNLSETTSNRVLAEDYCKEDPGNLLWDGELASNRPRVDQLLSNSVYKSCPSDFGLFFSFQERVRNPAG